MNDDLTARVQLRLPPQEGPLAQAKVEPNRINRTTEGGDHELCYKMYVDDSQTATFAEEEKAKQLVATSAEATYILRSYPGRIHQPFLTPTMAYDKVEWAIGTQEVILGIHIDTDRMIIRIPTKKLIRLRDLLKQHWNRNRKRFVVRHAAQLVGNLLWCLKGNWWLTHLCFSFMSIVRTALANNGKRLIRTRHWQAILAETSELWLEPTAGEQDGRLLGLSSRWNPRYSPRLERII